MDSNRTPPPSPNCVSQFNTDRDNVVFLAVRKVLEQNGEMGSIKALIQKKVLDILRGGDKSAIRNTNPDFSETDTRIVILNSLILEYFHWFGFQYSVEMFASESGGGTNCPNRDLLEKHLGEYNRELPILLEIVLKLFREHSEAEE